MRADADRRGVIPTTLTVLVSVAVGTFGGPAAADVGARVDALNREGVAYYEARKYHQAIERFRKALELAPGNRDVRVNLASAWSGLGVERLNSGESKAAADAFSRGLAVREDFYAHFGLGYIGFMAQDDAGARQHLEVSLKLRPDFAKAHKFLALIDYRHGREEVAIRRMAKAASLDAEDREAQAILRRWKVEAGVIRRFRSIETPRFLVRHDPRVPARAVTALREYLDAAFESLAYRLGHRPRKRLVVAFFEEKSFHEATGTYHWVGGLFDGQVKVAVRVDEVDDALARGELYRALVHELTHAFVKDLYAACPNWLNEGIAQYFELLPLAGGRDRGARAAPAGVARGTLPSPADLARAQTERRQRLETQLRAHFRRRVSFARIPTRLWAITDEDEARWTYMQGLGFVEHLVERYRTFRLRILLETARREGSLGRAFALTYGQDLDALETAWWASLSSSSPGG